ncbi:MAG TPA: acetyl ornithine aminotransferase family protein [Gemmatimonadales bacterium]|jgi:4-aminobutyrate aminotransferase|nr:acetyl ornithine aminotransferase family protein [Gemmatimonadales bacterium]
MSEKPYPRILTPPPGPKARAIVARDKAVAATCYIKEYPLVVARGEGPMVEDVDGNRFLDFMAGIGVCSTGHSHPEVVAAIKQAADRFLHICGGDFYYEGMAALCERLAALTPGPGRKRVFLTNSGTEAVEGAMKLARHATRRPAFLAFKGAFHGRSYGALSLTSSKARQHAGFLPLLPEVHHVFYGYCYRCEYGKTFPSCGIYCVDIIERDLFARHLDPKDVAAVFVEPLQGEGGYILPPPGWLAAVRALCDRHGILLVIDEVQSGIGRTGKMFACEHDGVVPDILVTAKGLGSGMPIGAIIAREEISTWEPGAHGTTFGGNPVCCAAALATLDLVQRELVSNARVRGEQLATGLKALAEKHGCIGEVRGRGLMQGIEFVSNRTTREPAGELPHQIEQLAFAKGLLVLAAGKNALRLAPPLIVDERDVAIALEILDQCLSELD